MNKQPTFLLRVNPNDIYQRYKSGEFFRPVPIKTKLIIAKPQIKPSSLFKDDLSSIEYCKTNQKEVEVFHKTGCNTGGRCDYCKEDFETERIGYPLAYEHKSLLINNIYQNAHLFWVDGCFCSYSCCLTFVKMIKPSIQRDSNMVDVEILLKLMAKLNHLLIKEANCTQFPDWKDEKVIYTKTSSIIKIPAQIVYAKLTQ